MWSRGVRVGTRVLLASFNVRRLVHGSDSKTCWKCGVVQEKLSLFCTENSCRAVQGIEPDEVDYFRLFSMKREYQIDERALETSFKELQKILHPDKFANMGADFMKASTQSSTTVNIAFQTLKSPLLRAQYLVRLEFGKNLSNENTSDDQQLLVEMFELREAIEDAKMDKQVTADLHERIEKELSSSRQTFGSAVLQNDEVLAIQAAKRMKYFTTMVEELQNR